MPPTASPITYTIASSDSGGGGVGIQGNPKTLHARDAHTLSAITTIR